MVQIPTCPQCGTQLHSDGPAGLCPKCLIAGAFESSAGGAESGSDGGEQGSVTATDDDFGRYRILRPLGEGGMGTVYLAEQLEPVRRCVALKVIKSGMDSSQVLARFDHERQALAMMDHPNIARMFDAGANSRGRPYFVMEYIDGSPITEYCDGRRMRNGDRLPLFLAVCRAVQHAHQKGVVHRDLKPSNVMVAEQDGAPVVKVIDFGIAKATDQWATENSWLTQFGQVVGTPEYASPEQADTLTGDIDARSDVYSLGVILYELLIGAVPFESARLRAAGLAGMLRILREEEPPTMVEKLSAMGDGVAEVAARRQTDAGSLRRLAGGDLNSIVMKALEKGRDQRYASVAELVADVQRYLEDRPVLALPPRRLYQARKFLRRHRMAAFGTAAGVVFLLLSGVTVWSLAHGDAPRRLKLTGKDTLVLAEFENRTGEPDFDDTLRQGLAVELAQSPFLSLISDAQVRQTLALMGKQKETPLTAEVARQVCERTASAAVLEGSIARVGSQYVLGLHARDCETGNTLDREQAAVSRREEVLNGLSEMSRRFRTKVGESLVMVERHSRSLPEATTQSIEALKAYSTAMKLVLSTGTETGLPFFRRAVEIDPNFAMAHAHVALAYSINGLNEVAAASSTKAWQLRERVSDRERFFIDFTYDRHVTGNLEKAYQTLELWSQTYPRRGATANPQDLLGGISSHGTGRYERAIAAARDGIGGDPDFAIGYLNLALGYFYTDRFGEASTALAAAAARKADAPVNFALRYHIAVIEGDSAATERAIRLARENLRADPWMEHMEAIAYARSGRFELARLASSRAVAVALQSREREAAGRYLASRAVWEAICGNAAEGKKAASAALEISKGRDVSYPAGLALGLSGNGARAKGLAEEMVKRFPEDTFVNFTYAPVLQGVAALGQGRPAESLQALEAARPYELAINGLNFPRITLGGLYSAYVRGEALLAAKQYGAAAVEFQKILEHRGLVGADPMGVVAHLRLGQVYSGAGDRAKAKGEYQTFFALWKNADPALPVLKMARAEYERL